LDFIRVLEVLSEADSLKVLFTAVNCQSMDEIAQIR
jgi:hypothetical protein